MIKLYWNQQDSIAESAKWFIFGRVAWRRRVILESLRTESQYEFKLKLSLVKKAITFFKCELIWWSYVLTAVFCLKSMKNLVELINFFEFRVFCKFYGKNGINLTINLKLRIFFCLNHYFKKEETTSSKRGNKIKATTINENSQYVTTKTSELVILYLSINMFISLHRLKYL